MTSGNIRLLAHAPDHLQTLRKDPGLYEHAVRAQTLPEENASTRILKKCGYKPRGAVNHPEDGLIWLWELPIPGSD